MSSSYLCYLFVILFCVHCSFIDNCYTFIFCTGGLDSKIQEAALRKGPDIVIATPGRLVDHLHNTPSFSLQTVEIIVLDEADRYTRTNKQTDK